MDKQKENVALSSVVASVFLTVLKLIVGILTGSMGIISEAAHSALDLGAALITYFAVRISKKPADTRHNYGHGKVENISALAETILLFITCFWIIYEAVHRLITGNINIEIAWFSFAVMIVSIVIDFSRSRALDRVAKETKSQALEADALHFRSDIYSSSVVIVGLALSLFGIKGADSVAAIGVAILVLFVSYKLGTRTISVLIDAAPEGLADHVKEQVLNVAGIVDVKRIRVRPTGNSYFIDMAIAVSRKIPLEKMDKITKDAEKIVKKMVPGADVVIHVKPVALKDETIAERIQIIASNQGFSTHNISVRDVKGKKFIDFDLEVGNDLNLQKAHQEATKLEELIHSELGNELDINTHIEPAPPVSALGQEIDQKIMVKLEKLIMDIQKRIPEVKKIYGISGQTVDNRIYLSLNCQTNGSISLGKSHDLAGQIEHKIREKIPSVSDVNVHMEPSKI